ncbi:MAG: TIGR04282 family arsenosugar biosynthesis glycosyltransferase [Myxococcales bacterium]
MRACVCVFAKAPLPGKVKTRLSGSIGAANAAAFARASLQDTWTTVCGLPWARPVLATDAAPEPSWRPQPQGEWWLQGRGDPGTRLERVLTWAIAAGDAALVVAGDAPGIPRSLLEDAVEALESCDAVLGPSGDGGFYLIGARTCPEGLIAGLPWSRPDTLATMRRRLKSFDLGFRLLDRWDDVDDLADLRVLERRLELGEIEAPETARTLRQFRPRLVRRETPTL